MMRRDFTDSLNLQMSVKLALSILAACVTAGAGAVSWAYAFQQRIVDQTDQRQVMRLKAYPSSMELERMFQILEGQQQVNYIDLRNRLDAIRTLVYQRTTTHR
jgi:hypothetical protein